MTIELAAIIIDAADLNAESHFWHQLLGGTLTRTPTHHFLQADGRAALVIQLAPDHRAPDWPHAGDQQLHLDFRTDDLAASDRVALDAGARRLGSADGTSDGSDARSRIYASPAGHPLCLRAA